MSSIFSFDIYGTYINKRATNAQLIKWSHIGVVGSALLISTLSTALYKVGVDLNWLLYFLGILIWSVPLRFSHSSANQEPQPRNVPDRSGTCLETSTEDSCNHRPDRRVRGRYLGLGRNRIRILW